MARLLVLFANVCASLVIIIIVQTSFCHTFCSSPLLNKTLWTDRQVHFAIFQLWKGVTSIWQFCYGRNFSLNLTRFVVKWLLVMGDEDKMSRSYDHQWLKNESYRALTKRNAKLNMGVHVPEWESKTDVYMLSSTGLRSFLPWKKA